MAPLYFAPASVRSPPIARARVSRARPLQIVPRQLLNPRPSSTSPARRSSECHIHIRRPPRAHSTPTRWWARARTRQQGRPVWPICAPTTTGISGAHDHALWLAVSRLAGQQWARERRLMSRLISARTGVQLVAFRLAAIRALERHQTGLRFGPAERDSRLPTGANAPKLDTPSWRPRT